MRPAVVVPAFEAARTVAAVVEELLAALGSNVPIIVVDDGSADGTADVARTAGATVISHAKNMGKGAALATGLRAAHELGCDTALTVDADGQHPTDQAKIVLDTAGRNPEALVLGVRDMRKDGAPRANTIGNAVSNFFVSLFSGRRLRDTQCGLRCYPVAPVLAIAPRDKRFGFEAEVILRAAWRKIRIVEVAVRVLYPPLDRHHTHYRAVIDSIRIGVRVTATVLLPWGKL